MGGEKDPPTDLEKEGALASAVREMQKELGRGFHVEGKFPFVVGGDFPARYFRRYMDHTIFSSYKAFYTQFFKTHPTHVHKVYLFWGKESYEENVWRLWKHRPSTPWGYYMPSSRSLIMNIARGGGTLVHELVHALMEYDFPEAPMWLDEGMGSLFEQCSNRYGRILGLENWRLPILKRGIARKRVKSLRDLLSTTRFEFIDDNSSLNYAQARYFCMYMQQEGLLETLYRLFRDNHEKDPTGISMVEEVFEKKLTEIEPAWLAWVGTIHYRR
jgi:hypothetical protein